VAKGGADAVAGDRAEIGPSEEAVVAGDLSSLGHPGRVTIGRLVARLKAVRDQIRAISVKNVQAVAGSENYGLVKTDNASRKVETAITFRPSA
jgi:hypothetical protein